MPDLNKLDPKQPLTGAEAVQGLMQRFSSLAERLGHISVSMENLRDRMEQLGHLAGRVAASMMLLVGAPRLLRGGLMHGLMGPHGASGRARESTVIHKFGGQKPTTKRNSERLIELLMEERLARQGGTTPTQLLAAAPKGGTSEAAKKSAEHAAQVVARETAEEATKGEKKKKGSLPDVSKGLATVDVETAYVGNDPGAALGGSTKTTSGGPKVVPSARGRKDQRLAETGGYAVYPDKDGSEIESRVGYPGGDVQVTDKTPHLAESILGVGAVGLEEAAKELADWVEEVKDLPLFAHNGRLFDGPTVKRTAGVDLEEHPGGFHDTQDMYKEYRNNVGLPTGKGDLTLDSMYEHFKGKPREGGDEHTALGDAKVLAEVVPDLVAALAGSRDLARQKEASGPKELAVGSLAEQIADPTKAVREVPLETGKPKPPPYVPPPMLDEASLHKGLGGLALSSPGAVGAGDPEDLYSTAPGAGGLIFPLEMEPSADEVGPPGISPPGGGGGGKPPRRPRVASPGGDDEGYDYELGPEDVARHPEFPVSGRDVLKPPEYPVGQNDVLPQLKADLSERDVLKPPEFEISAGDVLKHPEFPLTAADVLKHPEFPLSGRDVLKPPEYPVGQNDVLPQLKADLSERDVLKHPEFDLSDKDVLKKAKYHFHEKGPYPQDKKDPEYGVSERDVLKPPEYNLSSRDVVPDKEFDLTNADVVFPDLTEEDVIPSSGKEAMGYHLGDQGLREKTNKEHVDYDLNATKDGLKSGGGGGGKLQEWVVASLGGVKASWRQDVEGSGLGGPGHVDSHAHRRQEALAGELGTLAKVSATLSESFRGLRVGMKQFLFKRGTDPKTGASLPSLFDKTTKGIAGAAPMAALAGTSIAGGLLKAASPDTFDLLTGSFKLLAATMGGAMIPAVAKVAMVLQLLSEAVEGMPAGLKDSLGSLAVAGIGIALFVTAVTRVQMALQAFGMSLTGAAGKFALGLGMAAAAVGALYMGLERTAEKKKDIEKTKEDLDRPVGFADAGKNLTDDHKERLREIMGVKDEKKRAVLLKAFEQGARNEEEEGMSTYRAAESDRKGKITGPLSTVQDNLMSTPFVGKAFRASSAIGMRSSSAIGMGSDVDPELLRGSKEGKSVIEIQKVAGEKARAAREAIEISRQIREGYITPGDASSAKLGISPGDSKEGSRDVKKKDTEGKLGQLSGLLASMSTKAQPEFSSVEDAYKKMQIESLGKDPLEQKLEEIKRENLDKMLTELTKLGAISDEIRASVRSRVGVG